MQGMYNADELSELLQVSKSKAYKFMQEMNAELKAEGYLTIPGKIPVAYVEKRFFGMGAANAKP